jgi:hypothetical protein
VSHEAGCVLKLPPCGASSYRTVSIPEPPSLVFDVSVTVPRTGSPGLCIVADGAVLSIRRFATTDGEASTFPALSVAIVRKSYRPSATLVVSNATLYDEVVSVAIVVHEPPPAGRRWNATDATSEPPVSLAELVSVTVPRRFAPGSSCALVGAFVSDLTTLPHVAVLQLPALSATRNR